MRCPNCGEFLQSGATTCIRVGCADQGKPLAAEVVQAAEVRRTTPTAPMLALDPFARIVVALALLASVVMSVGLIGDMLAIQAIGWVTFLATIAALVPWLRRARKNFDALPGPDPQLAERSWLPTGVAGVLNGVLGDVVAGSLTGDVDAQRRPRLLVAIWTVLSVVAGIMTTRLFLFGAHDAGVREVTAGLLLASAIGFDVLVLLTTAAQLRRFKPATPAPPRVADPG